MVEKFILFALISYAYSNDMPVTVCEASHTVANNIDSITKQVIIETPNNWLSTIYAPSLGLWTINNFGLNGENVELLKDCRKNYHAKNADECSSIIIERVGSILRKNAPDDFSRMIDEQIKILESISIDTSTMFDSGESSISSVVNHLNQYIDNAGSDITISLQDDILSSENYERFNLSERKDMRINNVLDMLKRIRIELYLCLRQSPGEVRILLQC